MVPVDQRRERLSEDVGRMVLRAHVGEAHDGVLDLLHHEVHFLKAVLHSLAVTAVSMEGDNSGEKWENLGADSRNSASVEEEKIRSWALAVDGRETGDRAAILEPRIN